MKLFLNKVHKFLHVTMKLHAKFISISYFSLEKMLFIFLIFIAAMKY